MAEMKIIVGLGNPGKKYADSRHNIGFCVIDYLASFLKTKVRSKKFGAQIGLTEFGNAKLLLLKPQSYMNRSGQVVATAVGFYQIALDNLLVVLDDMSLEVGRLRIRSCGSSGGHNGLDDIIEKLGTEKFSRLRIGIGQSSEELSVDYVLDKPFGDEKTILDKAIEKGRDAVLCWIQYGVETAMNKVNPLGIIDE